MNIYEHLSNEDLVSERDHAYEIECILNRAMYMWSKKRLAEKRTTAITNEVCTRMIAGTMNFNDAGELI